jgi:hypothetical protein
MEHSEPLARRLAAQRFRRKRQEFAAALAGLLGEAAPVPLGDPDQAGMLSAEYQASYDAAAPNEWALVRREWPAAEATDLVDTIHRLARNAGGRRIWVLGLGGDAQAAASHSDAVLGNPLGFAAATAHQLALLDAEVPAGVSLARHSHHIGPRVSFSWELEVWGEPWLSAATRALRGLG